MQARRILLRILLLVIKILLAVVIAVGVYRVGEFAYGFGHSLYDNESVSDPPGKDVAIVLPEGSTVGKVAALLEAKGLIKDELVFRVQERLSHYHGQIQAGNYVLNTSMNAEEILAILSGHAEDVIKDEDDG